MSRLRLLWGPRYGVGPAPPVEVVVHNTGELQTALFGATTAGGNTTILVADGGTSEYGASTSVMDLKNYAPVGMITIRGQTDRGAMLPRITVENCANLVFERLELYGLRSGGPGGVVSAINSTNIWFDDCEIHADELATQFFGGSFRVEGGNGLDFIEGEVVQVQLSGTPTGGSGYWHNVPGVSTPTNFVVSGSASDYKVGNGSGHWGNSSETSEPDRWYDSSTPRTLYGVTSTATRLIREKTSNVEFLVGVYSSTTQPSTGLRVENCYIHNTKRGVGFSGTDSVIRNNRIEDSYNAPIDIAGYADNGSWNNNRCIGVWAQSTDGEPAGTNGPHSSVWGFSFTYRVVRNMEMLGNISLIGRRRQDAGWGIPFATGPKINDMETTKTIAITGTSGVVNSGVASWEIMPGTRLIGSGVSEGTEVVSVESGVGATGTTFTVNISQTVSSRVMYVQGRAEITMKGNIFDCNGAIGVEWDFVTNSYYDYNDIVSTRDTRLASPTIPQFYIANTDGSCYARHNNMLQPALGGVSRYISEQFYKNSYANNMMILNATSGPASYEENYQGIGGPTPFSGATLENIIEMFTPIPGSAADGKGCTFYWDFDTGTALNPSEPGAPVTTLATGVDLPMVTFGGASAMRWSVAGAENLLDFSNTNQLTVVWYIDMAGSDSSTVNLATSAGSDIYVRRMSTGTDNRLRFILKDSAGTTQQIDSFLTLSAADGPTVVALSVDFSEYKIYVWKGPICDPFVSASAWTGQPLRATSNTFTFMASETGTPASFATGNVGALLVHDGFIDGSVAANHTKLVALDGKPADWGTGGTNLFGGQVRGYLKGVAADYNDAGGLNLGSANGLSKFQKLGTNLVDA